MSAHWFNPADYPGSVNSYLALAALSEGRTVQCCQGGDLIKVENSEPVCGAFMRKRPDQKTWDITGMTVRDFAERTYWIIPQETGNEQ